MTVTYDDMQINRARSFRLFHTTMYGYVNLFRNSIYEFG